MPVSADIYSNIGRGVRPLEDPQNALLKALQVQGAQEQMQTQRTTRARTEDEYRRGVERSNRLQGLLSGDYADDEARADALLKGGFFKESEDFLKGRAEVAGKRATVRKTDADTTKTLTETDAARYKQHLDLLGAVQDPESFKQWVQLGMSSGAIKEGGNMLLQAASQVQTPQQFQQLQARVGMGLKDYLEKNAPKFSTVNAGNAQVTTGRGGLFGEVMPELGQTTTINQSPDSVATDARATADRAQREREAAKARGVQLQIAGMADARAKERLDFDRTRTPEEKPLNDTQSKALLFGSRMRAANTVLDSLAKDGTLASVPGSRSGYGVGPVVTALSSAKQQQLDQAKRDFVNAVLRRESGAVIADSEFENADKQYFPQIGDSKEVIAQKKRNRELATQGILMEVPENRRNSLLPTPQMPTADEIRRQADNILRGG